MMPFFKSSLFVSCLLVVSACSEDTKKPNPRPDCEDTECVDDDGTDDGVSDDDDATGAIDGGKPTLDGGKPPTKNDAATASDAGVTSDAGKPADAAVSMDAALTSDAGSTTEDAGKVDAGKVDAGQADAALPVEDAGEPSEDAGEPRADAASANDSGSTSPGSCAGATPHGCFTPDSDNPDSCPARTPEVGNGGLGSLGGCDDGAVELGTSCDYVRSRDTATCLCIVGGRWLCNYP